MANHISHYDRKRSREVFQPSSSRSSSRSLNTTSRRNTRWEGSAKLARRSPQSKEEETFACSVCHVSVPCQYTLNIHLLGKNHLKRVKEIQESRRLKGKEEKGGYRTGPLEMAMLSENEREELVRLRRHNNILKEKLKGFRLEREEQERLRRQAKFCRENHWHCKQEHDYESDPSTSTTSLTTRG